MTPQGADGEMVIEGYATTFDIPYRMEGSDINEVVLRSALDGADMSDVILQYNHDGYVYARGRNGTLEIELDAHGMHIRADLAKSSHGADLYNDIKNGLYDRMSWGFLVPDDGWEYDLETNTRTITKVTKVYDVSAVSIPANQGTDIHARSCSDGAIETIRKEFSERAVKAERDKKERLALLIRLQR